MLVTLAGYLALTLLFLFGVKSAIVAGNASYWAVEFGPKPALHEDDGKPVYDVVMLHGVNGVAYTQYPMAMSLGNRGVSVCVVNYPSRLFEIPAIAGHVIAGFVSHAPRKAVVGHSMGGIVARHMQREWSNAGESAPPLVTIGTPHGGMDVLDLAHKSPRAHNLLTTFMGRAVPALASCRTEDHPSVAATTLCITSHWPSLTALVQGWDDGVVPVKDQVLEGSRSLSIGRCPHALSVLMPSTMHAVTEFVLARPG